jgi:hypothetical protein
MLGHASPAITEGGSYIDRDRAAAAERGTALRMLADRLRGCANGRTRTRPAQAEMINHLASLQ